MEQNNKSKGRTAVYCIFLLVLACIFMFPLLWMVVSSFKSDTAIYSDMTSIKAFLLPFTDFSPFNYSNVVNKYPIIHAAFNSFSYILVIIVLSEIVNSMAGYAFARLKFPFSNAIFSLIIMLIIVPIQTIMLPQFVIVYNLGWVNNYMGLIAPVIANCLYIFLFRQTFLNIPAEIEEAGVIDGANEFVIFFRLVIPLVKPTMATVAILNFIGMWNDFVWPTMVITSPDLQTIQMALSTMFQVKPQILGEIMAGLTIVTIPVLFIFLFLQKYYVQGIASTGAKN